MQDSDPARLMAAALQNLAVNPSTDDEVLEKEEYLQHLIDWAEDIDQANDLQKMGGLEVISRLLHNKNDIIRSSSAQLVGTMVQNNPNCQEKILEAGMLPALLQMVDTDTNCTVRAKSLFAVSSLIRDQPGGQDKFLHELDGLSVLMRAMQTGNERLQTKSAFMMAALCTERQDYIDVLVNMGMVEQLVGLLQSEHQPYHEHLMKALLTLVQGNTRAVRECRRHELNLTELLQQRSNLLKGKEEYKEEFEFGAEIEKLCFGTTGSGSSTVDR